MKTAAVTPQRKAGDLASGAASADLLMRKAAEEFAALGFEGLSMRALAEKCSVSTAAIYYHFASKEALYEEVCRSKFDQITYVMEQNLRSASSAEARLEIFINTLFDEWYRDNTLLLLTQRDVINALISPGHCMAVSHYEQLMGMLRKMLSTYFDRPLDDDFNFTFGSLLFGYCSLMSFDRKVSTLAPAEYQQHRKAVLLKYCRWIWSSTPPLS